VHIYDLGFTLHVNVNVEHVSANVKLCKSNLCYVRQHMCQTNTLIWFYVAIFLLGEGENFIMFLLIGQPNKTLEKNKTKQNKTKHQNMHP
jgi:hypothetical protein